MIPAATSPETLQPTVARFSTLTVCACEQAGKPFCVIVTKGEQEQLMSDPVIVRDEGGSSGAAIGITLIVIVAVLIALFAWHPWSATSTSTTHNTTITQPGNNSGANGSGSSTTNSTTTTNGGGSSSGGGGQ